MFNDHQSKALRQAINERDTFKVKMLLDRGVDPNSANRKGNTALHRAVVSGDMGMVDLVLSYRPDPSIRNRANLTPAALADHLGFRDIAHRLGMSAPSNQCRLAP